MVSFGIQRAVALACVLQQLFHHAAGWSPTAKPNMSRRALLDGLAASVVANAILASPAHADITNKLASSTALSSVKRSKKQLKGLLPLAQENDFTGVKSFFRTPPFDNVRRNTFILVRGAEDGPKADELGAVYKAFISSVEKIDGTASLGARGRKIPQLQMSEEYLVIESALNDFLKVAEEAVEIPIRYDD